MVKHSDRRAAERGFDSHGLAESGAEDADFLWHMHRDAAAVARVALRERLPLAFTGPRAFWAVYWRWVLGL